MPEPIPMTQVSYSEPTQESEEPWGSHLLTHIRDSQRTLAILFLLSVFMMVAIIIFANYRRTLLRESSAAPVQGQRVPIERNEG